MAILHSASLEKCPVNKHRSIQNYVSFIQCDFRIPKHYLLTSCSLKPNQVNILSYAHNIMS